MAFDSVPWLVGGGAEHSPEVGRLLAFAATNGASGVVGISDLQVQAEATPAASVRIAPGALVIPNRWSGQQSYLARNATQTSLAIPGTGSGAGRSDLVVVRIDDPQYAGDAPADPRVGPYVRADLISGVSSTATKADVPYPHIVIARLDLPASTATITASMITDLRKVANPRRERVLYADQLDAVEEDELTHAEREHFPNNSYFRWTVDAPEWATEAKIAMTWNGVKSFDDQFIGWLWVELDDEAGNVVATKTIRVDTPTNASGVRSTLMVSDTVKLPTAMRGQTLSVDGVGNRSHGNGRLHIDSGSTLLADIEFAETPVSLEW